MPGVVVSTQTAGSPSANSSVQSGQFFIVGLTERGPTDAPILVQGMADVAALTGARVSYGVVWDQLTTFFNEGGLRAYISRVVGAAATVGTLSLVDRAGSPLNTLRVDAANPGSWSTQLTVQVRDGSLVNTFRITVYLNGVSVEDHNNLASPAAAALAFTGSQYVKVTNLGSATAAPNNNPAVIAATALSAGSDDRGSVVDANYVSALSNFNPDLGDGAVAIPGRTTTAIWQGIDAHCVANNRIGLLASAQGDTKSTLLGRTAEVTDEYCGIFTPWVHISDGAGGQLVISPEGYVAACRSKAINQTGAWRVPAGAIAQASTLLDVDQAWSASDANDLDSAHISVIRVIAGTIRLYGWRSTSSDIGNYSLLNQRDLLNSISVAAKNLMEQYVFQTIDSAGHLQSQMASSLIGILDPIAQAGGLFPFLAADGSQIDPGYKVETGSSVNTTAVLNNNEVRARISVRVSPSGALITLTIVKVANTSGL